jgi:tRNA(Ile)-lysidine synthase
MTIDPISDGERAKLFSCLDGVTHAGLGVSGGADSMALMHLAHLWIKGAGAGATRFSVLTVDHGLRDEAAHEAEWVEEKARALGLSCTILRWHPGEKTSRIQEDARAARYGLMAEYAHIHGIDALLTAHHLDDQAETLLMRLGRGSGLDGLAAIPKHGHWAGLRILRPLLDMPKARLVATLESSGLEWLEDPSNDDARFERVRFRRAMSELEALGISADALARSARRLRRAREALDKAAGQFLQQHCKLEEAGFCRISAEAFSQAPEEVALRAMSRVLQGVGGQASPPRLTKLEALLETLKSGEATPLTLGGCQLVPGEEEVLILRESGRSRPCELVLNPGECGLWDNRYQVSLDAGCSTPVQVRALGKNGYGEVRARLGKSLILPERAAESLVSFWLDEHVLAVPPLGYSQGAGCNAKFVNSALFT